MAAFTRAHHLFLSWVRRTQTTPPHLIPLTSSSSSSSSYVFLFFFFFFFFPSSPHPSLLALQPLVDLRLFQIPFSRIVPIDALVFRGCHVPSGCPSKTPNVMPTMANVCIHKLTHRSSQTHTYDHTHKRGTYYYLLLVVVVVAAAAAAAATLVIIDLYHFWAGEFSHNKGDINKL